MNEFEVYMLFMFLPKLGTILAVVGGFVGCIAFIMACLQSDSLTKAEKEKEQSELNKQCAMGLLIFAISLLIPSQKEMAVLYLAPKIINNQVVQNMPAEITKFIEREVSKND